MSRTSLCLITTLGLFGPGLARPAAALPEGQVLVEGDIVIDVGLKERIAKSGALPGPKPAEITRGPNDGAGRQVERLSTVVDPGTGWGVWANGVVPYVVQPEAEKFRATILAAMARIQLKSNITFKARTDEAVFLAFNYEDVQGYMRSVCTCYGLGAPQSGTRYITLRDDCGNARGVVIHEILHALGSPHEQSRKDRDQFIDIHRENMMPAHAAQFDVNFYAEPLGPYDFKSIMHYFDTAFSVDGKRKTITPKDPRNKIDPGDDLSDHDAEGLRRLYPNTRRAVLYKDVDYRGDAMGVAGDVPSLKAIKFDGRASSVRLMNGVTKIALYDKPGFQGRCIVYRGDTPRFEGFNDDFQSLKVDAECSSARATLYIDTNFRGNARDLDADTPALGGFGREISSIRLGPGVQLALFSEPDYRGACKTLGASTVRVADAGIANDSIQSIWVGRACPGTAVRLYLDTNMRGRSVDVVGDLPNLKAIGFNDEASSAVLTGGLPVAVYKDSEYRGTCFTVRGDVARLGATPVGNDAVSSIRVRWTCESGPVR